MQRDFATINKYSLTTQGQYADITGGGKVFIYVTGGDVRIALDQYSLTNEPYFILLDGTTLVLDYPIGIDAPIWVRQHNDGDSGVEMRTLITANPVMDPTPVRVEA